MIRFNMTNRVLEQIWCLIILCRSLVEDDVDDNTSRCSRVQIPDHDAVCEFVCYYSDQLLDKNKHSENMEHRRCCNANGAVSASQHVLCKIENSYVLSFKLRLALIGWE